MEILGRRSRNEFIIACYRSFTKIEIRVKFFIESQNLGENLANVDARGNFTLILLATQYHQYSERVTEPFEI